MTRWSDVRLADISRAWDASAARQPRRTRANGMRAASGVPALCDGRRGQSIIRKDDAPASGVAGVRDRHVRIGVEPFLFVARSAVLVARHSEQGEQEHKAEHPADKTQDNPTKTHGPINPVGPTCSLRSV